MDIIKNDILKEKMYKKEYKNGLRAYIMPKPGYQKTYAMFATNFGSINDKFVLPETGETMEVPDGVAHFLEHKLFSMKDGSAMDKFAEMGSNSNAYTSFTHTSSLLSCTNGFEDSFKLLLDFVQNPYITEESVENEKGIIGQEIRMYEDDPDWQVYFNFINCLYNDFSVKKDIAGTVESISGIDKDLVEYIDADDNGQFPKIEAPYKVKTLPGIIKIFNPSYDSGEDESEQFLLACNLAKMILKEEILYINGKVMAEKSLIEELKYITDEKYVILDKFLPYEDTILGDEKYNNLLFVAYPSNRGGYAIKVIPKSLEDKTPRQNFPEEWAGLEGEELEQISGIEGLTFCHTARFIVSCKDIGSVYKVFDKIIS